MHHHEEPLSCISSQHGRFLNPSSCPQQRCYSTGIPLESHSRGSSRRRGQSDCALYARWTGHQQRLLLLFLDRWTRLCELQQWRAYFHVSLPLFKDAAQQPQLHLIQTDLLIGRRQIRRDLVQRGQLCSGQRLEPWRAPHSDILRYCHPSILQCFF
jgi:hypothetical protein